MKLIERLSALKERYAKLKRHRKKRDHIQREMVMLLCKQLRRENRQDRTNARN